MEFLDEGSLTVALAMLVGVLAVGVARHLRLPGIVVLIGAGVALGPDFADVIRPASLGDGLSTLVGFAVAVILFEGGMNLSVAQLRRQAKPLRRLVTIGGLVTAVGGAVAARLLMGFEWPMAALFGTLVIVTGPTVINPLVRRIRLRHDLSTILEAEGIFIDAVGATIAIMALGVALRPSGESLLHAVVGVGTTMGMGAVVGAVLGGALALLLRWKKVVPHGLENILALAFALTSFELANAVVHESGITAAIVAGAVLGNAGSHAHEQVLEFKEQLTVLFIGTLFVVLSADVRIADVIGLGWEGVATVVVLMLVVRPITVLVSTFRTQLGWREKAFLSWLAPRGIVAAAVASLFAQELAAAGHTIGVKIRALVFLVIAMTVVIQGLTGGIIAGLLGLRRRSDEGFVILGANGVGLRMAEVLQERDEEVVLIDSNPDLCRQAEEAGFKVVYGNGLQRRTLLRARIDERRGAIAVTPNENVNYIFAQRVREIDHAMQVWIALESESSGVTAAMLEKLGVGLLFGKARRIEPWRLRTGGAIAERWLFTEDPRGDQDPLDPPPGLMLALVGIRGDVPLILDGTVGARSGDLVEFTYYPDKTDEARAWLLSAGWIPPDEAP